MTLPRPISTHPSDYYCYWAHYDSVPYADLSDVFYPLRRFMLHGGIGQTHVASGSPTPLVRQLVSGTEFHGENGLAGVVSPPPTVKQVDMLAAELIRSIVRK